VSGSGISCAICKSAPRSRQIAMPAPHHFVFYRPDALPAAQPTASKHWRPKHTHTHPFNGPFPGLPGSAGTRTVKPIWILLKQETVSGSGISWTTCTSASHSRQITMPVPDHSSFLQARCPSCRPTNSVKALKALKTENKRIIISVTCCSNFMVKRPTITSVHFIYNCLTSWCINCSYYN